MKQEQEKFAYETPAVVYETVLGMRAGSQPPPPGQPDSVIDLFEQ